MGILMSSEIKEQIATETKECCESLQVITAFCKQQGLKFLDDNIKTDLKQKRILVRFRMDDILKGASDLQLFDYCKKNNWDLYVRFDLHAKTYIFDKKRCVIGSANLTSKGLNLYDNGNYEIASMSQLELEDIKKLNRLFDDSILMNDEIYQMMKEQLDQAKHNKNEHFEWSYEITSLFKPEFDILFTYDFPKYSCMEEYKGQAIDFLKLDHNWTERQLKEAFRWSKSYLWLQKLLVSSKGEMYFGEITSCLHNVLVNDPKPYRKEVKELLQNLLIWIQELDMKEIVIDRPNHSQRVRLNIK